MGFFSWRTSDTDKSIANLYSCRSTFPVYVLCPDGTNIKEQAYEGYGDFGGRDIFALIANWTCPEKCVGDDEIDRRIGLDLLYENNTDGNNNNRFTMKYPVKIVENPNLKYDDVAPSEDCEAQGFFYDDFDDEDGDE